MGRIKRVAQALRSALPSVLDLRLQRAELRFQGATAGLLGGAAEQMGLVRAFNVSRDSRSVRVPPVGAGLSFQSMSLYARLSVAFRTNR